jgi:hypothetical protein
MAPLLLATVCGTLLRRVRKGGGAGGEAGEMQGAVGASARETLYLRQEHTSAKVAAVSNEVGRLGSRLRLSRRELKPRMRQVRAASGESMAEEGIDPSITLFGVVTQCVQARFTAHFLRWVWRFLKRFFCHGWSWSARFVSASILALRLGVGRGVCARIWRSGRRRRAVRIAKALPLNSAPVALPRRSRRRWSCRCSR